MKGLDRISDEKRTTEPVLFLDMEFEKALTRFARAKPEKVRESVDRAQKKKPPGDRPARRRPKKSGSS